MNSTVTTRLWWRHRPRMAVEIVVDRLIYELSPVSIITLRPSFCKPRHVAAESKIKCATPAQDWESTKLPMNLACLLSAFPVSSSPHRAAYPTLGFSNCLRHKSHHIPRFPYYATRSKSGHWSKSVRWARRCVAGSFSGAMHCPIPLSKRKRCPNY